MKRSDGRILTTHAGSLPRPDDLLAMTASSRPGSRWTMRAGGSYQVCRGRGRGAAGGDWARQRQRRRVQQVQLPRLPSRFSGFGPSNQASGEVAQRRDFRRFADFYNELYPGRGGVGRQPMCVGPITYAGQAALQADIDNMKAALAASPAKRRS